MANYTGFKFVTINIPLIFNGSATTFYLQQNNELGIRDDAIILGIITRPHEATYNSSEDSFLADKEVYENSYLTLKSINKEDGSTNEIVSDYYIPDTSERALWMEPKKSDDIDWQRSYISIAPRALSKVSNEAVIEMVVIYTDHKEECNLNLNQKFFTGQNLYGNRYQRYERPLNTQRTKYPLSNAINIGIPKASWVVGFSLKLSPFPKSGDAQSTESFNSTYLTLKKGLELAVDSFPIAIAANTNYQNLLLSALDYVPLAPLPIGDWDFNKSFFELKNNTGVTNDQVFQFSLVWVDSHDKLQNPQSL